MKLKTNERRIGRYLAQGWSANVIAVYLLVLGVVLFEENNGADVIALIALPIYCFIVGLFGLGTAASLWIFELVIDRKLNFWWRALIGILSPLALAAWLALLFGFFSDFLGVIGVALLFVIVILPAVLLSGSRVNPLRFINMDLCRELPKYGWARAFSVIGVPLLRIASAVGLLEAFIYLASSRSAELGSWDVTDKRFWESIIAVIYLAITLIVSLVLPDKIIVVACGLIANSPMVAFALSAQLRATFEAQFFAVIVWVFISLWTLFLISQLIRSQTRRFIPVTMFEIRVRHALNHW